MPGPLFHPVSYPDDGGPEPVPFTRKDIAAAPAVQAVTSKIKHAADDKRHEDNWSRTPNTPHTGAIHVRTFRAKLSDDSLAYLDQQINEWLDAHPQYEVKLTNTTFGEWSTKLGKEPGIIVSVWV
ncbi:MAG: hypothetical protein HND58_14610 [Planctomycetota bacterium]|nr:MAG: hypothetical protein HND58_14610 [Planctomycetota bacterium]